MLKSSDSLHYFFITDPRNPVDIDEITTFHVLKSQMWRVATPFTSTVLGYAISEIMNQISGSEKRRKLHKCTKTVSTLQGPRRPEGMEVLRAHFRLTRARSDFLGCLPPNVPASSPKPNTQ